MPIADDAKGPMTMRQAVISYECGTGARRVAKAHKKKGSGQAVSEKAGKAIKAPTKKAKSAQG
jgi:hypothetical protein